MKYAEKILDELVDKYEQSKSFSGQNKVKQSFALVPEKRFKAYGDHSNYEVFESVNEAISELETLGYIVGVRRGAEVVKVQMNLAPLEEIYTYLKREPKEFIHQRLKDILTQYSGENQLIDSYIEVQKSRLAKNQKVQGYTGDLKDYEELFMAMSAILKLRTESYERDFSVRLFGDSKRFKQLEARLISIVYAYGDYPNKEGILGELNLLKNPTYVYVKGAGRITFGEQTLDLSLLPSDIAMSSENLAHVTSIDVVGDSVITIENLTSFHRFNSEHMLVVYLGGFHNSSKRAFLKQIYDRNREKKYLHFGDIDIGGILIYEHLKRKTEIPFEPFEMTVDNLVKYKGMTKKLTENDRKRGLSLMGKGWDDVLEYMNEHNCKLEQEAIEL